MLFGVINHLIAIVTIQCVLSSFIGASYGQHITIHVIPHSHCDPGWLDTFEGYYRKDVSHIITSAVNEIDKDPKRRFVWSEISFFSLWWDEQSSEVRDKVRKLVKEKRLEFVGGAWVQNDEANPNYAMVIDQYTAGHDFLMQYFGVRPRVAWSIDPFGHSSITPSLTALMGYDALVINRIHYQSKTAFKESKQMEFIWRGAEVGQGREGSDINADMFTHVLHTHYSAPNGFDWENSGVASITDANVKQRSSQYQKEMKKRANAYRTTHLLVPFGDDFKFKNAGKQFQNMDKIINQINSNGEMTIQYSTLSEYFDAVNQEATDKSIEFPLFKGDFFPYADNEDSYWTGYYTTRPNIKSAARNTQHWLRAGEILMSIWRSTTGGNAATTRDYQTLEIAREESALLLHHDAITGTARSNVYSNYLNRLATAEKHVGELSSTIIGNMLLGTTSTTTITTDGSDGGGAGVALLSFTYEKVKLTNDKDTHAVVLQNTLNWVRSEVVCVTALPTDHMEAELMCVLDEGGRGQVRSQISPVLTEQMEIEHWELCFQAVIPALGYTTYFIRFSGCNKDENLHSVTSIQVYKASGGKVRRGSDHIRGGGSSTGGSSSVVEVVGVSIPLQLQGNGIIMDFDLMGNPTTMHNIDLDESIVLGARLKEYSGSRSGAYIFRPSGDKQDYNTAEEKVISIYHGPLQDKIVVVGKSITSTYTLSHLQTSLIESNSSSDGLETGLPHIAVSHSLIAGNNKEVILDFVTDLGEKCSKEDSKFLTDNSLNFMVRPSRENSSKVAKFFYPMSSAAALRCEATQFTMFSKQSMGVSSSNSGSMEAMLHRNPTQDDGRGMAQGVNDNSRATIPFWFTWTSPQSTDTSWRHTSLLLHQPVVVYTYTGEQPLVLEKWLSFYNLIYSPLIGSLHGDLHMLSMKVKDATSDDIVIRLENLGQQRFKVHCDQIFKDMKLDTVRERTLSLHSDVSVLHDRLAWKSNAAEGMKTKSSSMLTDEKGDSQNTDEEGVFLSDAAMEILKQKHSSGRRLLSLNDANGDLSTMDECTFNIHARDIVSFIVTPSTNSTTTWGSYESVVFTNEDSSKLATETTLNTSTTPSIAVTSAWEEGNEGTAVVSVAVQPTSSISHSNSSSIVDNQQIEVTSSISEQPTTNINDLLHQTSNTQKDLSYGDGMYYSVVMSVCGGAVYGGYLLYKKIYLPHRRQKKLNQRYAV